MYGVCLDRHGRGDQLQISEVGSMEGTVQGMFTAVTSS